MTSKRREAKRALHDQMADLLAWSWEHSDDTMIELVDRYGADLMRSLTNEMVDFHARLGQSEYLARSLARSNPNPRKKRGAHG